MNLKHYSNQKLLTETRFAAKEEMKWNQTLLLHLKEIYERKLHLEMGYHSIRGFCMGEHGYDEKSASVRDSAVMLLVKLPEAERKLASGEISMTRASQLGSFIRREEAIRRSQGQSLMKKEKLSLLETASQETQNKLDQKMAMMTIAPDPRKREKERYLKDRRTKFYQFDANTATQEKIEKVKALMSHRNPSMSTTIMIEELLDFYLSKKDPVRKMRKGNTKPKNTVLTQGKTGQISLSTISRGPRTPTARQKKEVWRREGGKCVVCGSTYRLQCDHVIPWARGGKTAVKNLRLVCQRHNLYFAERANLQRMRV